MQSDFQSTGGSFVGGAVVVSGFVKVVCEDVGSCDVRQDGIFSTYQRVRGELMLSKSVRLQSVYRRVVTVMFS